MRESATLEAKECNSKSHVMWRMRNLALLLLAFIMVMSVRMDAKAAGSSMSTAEIAQYDKTYSGAFNGKDTHWYTFRMESSGCIHLNASADFSYVRYTIYDSNGKEVANTVGYTNSAGVAITDMDVHLTGGNYYFTVGDTSTYASYAGNYSFTLSYKNAEESFPETGWGTNNSVAEASIISLGKTYKGQLARNDEKDFYKFTMPSSGRVVFSLLAELHKMDCYLYNSAGEEIWNRRSYYANSMTGKISATETFDLKKGTYYWMFQSGYNGNYSFNTSFASAGESFEEAETGEGADDTIDAANKIDLNKTYKGQMAQTESKDWYTFSLSSANEVTLKFGADMGTIWVHICNAKGEKQTSQRLECDSLTKKINYSQKISLEAGTWYLLVEKYNTGKYSFSVNTHSHTYKEYITKATPSANGKVVQKCSGCGKVKSTQTIYRIKKVTLSAADYTYNGKAKKPSVTVKDSKGKKISASNYTVTYESGRKKVGSYKVTVKFKGNYTGTVTKTFKINPPKTQITKLTAQKKGFKITVKKQTTQTFGYQIQYATNKNFKNAILETISNSKNSAVYKGLKAERKYYVRVRTYKTVDGKKYYSDWSAVKTVKTK
ncbi:MAG: hypothetical protein NC081_03315 [Roseburia sp.]|nr:hypothetical protein [Roseburia sp.]